MCRDFTRGLLSALVAALLGLWPPMVYAATPVVLILGDSLSAEYGLARGQGWVALLDQKLSREHIEAKLINASISGETTAAGLSRLPALIKQHRPTHVVIELGGNDALRGLPIEETRRNLTALITQSKASKSKVILLGMQVPPNMGKRYAQDFAKVYSTLSKQYAAGLVPFFLKGVADRDDARDWFQSDGIHPIAAAHPIMLNNVWQVLGPSLLGVHR